MVKSARIRMASDNALCFHALSGSRSNRTHESRLRKRWVGERSIGALSLRMGVERLRDGSVR
jgi:hypothetical protein